MNGLNVQTAPEYTAPLEHRIGELEHFIEYLAEVDPQFGGLLVAWRTKERLNPVESEDSGMVDSGPTPTLARELYGTIKEDN